MKSTKSGKYINPTDQARKEARKRELKKVFVCMIKSIFLNNENE